MPLESEYPGVYVEEVATSVHTITGVATSTQILRLLTARIIGGYLRHHQVAPGELPTLISSVHRALGGLGAAPTLPEARGPAVPVRQSVRRDYVVCLECGFRGQALGRHLTIKHRLTPAQYRARWHLPRNHPIVAPVYTERRSAIARQLGLGRRRTRAAVSEPTPETPPIPKRRARRPSSPSA
jgi:predicted transcriptional regulator